MHVPELSPLAPRNLADLFVRPTRFFTGGLMLGSPPNYLLVTLALGVTSTLDRVSGWMLRDEIGLPTLTGVVPYEGLIGTWPMLWAFLLVSAVPAGAFIWLVGGWWYRVRLRWSGAVNPDKRQARLLFVYASFVQALPVLALLLALTLLYPDYRAAWDATPAWGAVALLLPFWACVVSYRGARVVFGVWAGRGLLWFLVLPGFVYLFALAVFLGLSALLVPEMPGTVSV